MLKGKTIAVVVPSYNEETQIKNTIDTIPSYVDKVVVVDDASSDRTSVVLGKYVTNNRSATKTCPAQTSNKPSKYNKADEVAGLILRQEERFYSPTEILNIDPTADRIVVIRHLKNSGVGAAIATGYRYCRDNKIDCTAVMAGDGQMDPSELESICRPVIEENVDYVKANRLSHRSAFFVVPRIRYFGNSVLSLLTKIASGYWRVSDSQTGYTAISLKALEAIRIHEIYSGYGNPNDILVKLNIAFCTIKEVPSKPVYDIGEKSKMKIFKVMPRISWLLFKSFFKRLYVKYLFRDFHPLFLLYHFAFFLLVINTPFFFRVLYNTIYPNTHLSLESLLIFIFLSISGLQSLFFAMWMDMMDNDRLQKT